MFYVLQNLATAPTPDLATALKVVPSLLVEKGTGSKVLQANQHQRSHFGVP